MNSDSLLCKPVSLSGRRIRFQMGGVMFWCKECLDSPEQLVGLGRQRPVTDKAAIHRPKQGVWESRARTQAS